MPGPDKPVSTHKPNPLTEEKMAPRPDDDRNIGQRRMGNHGRNEQIHQKNHDNLTDGTRKPSGDERNG
jgi:hypothetical protein